MPEAARTLLEQLGIALLLGLLVGLQRQKAESLIAGLRTFPIITLLGALSAALDVAGGGSGWLTAGGLVSLAGVMVASHAIRRVQDDEDPGTTTEVAALLMYLIGAYVVLGHRIVAIVLGATVAVLLQFKPELHGIAKRLGDQDLRAIMTFVLITCIILPVLPNQTYELPSPLDQLNPFEIWMMVVLLVGISLGGYLAYKFFGRDVGILLAGALGGAISSTATTMSYSRRSRLDAASSSVNALVVLIASTVVYVRVLAEISFVASKHFTSLAGPVAVMMAASAVTVGFVFLRVRHSPRAMPEQSNPTELRSALFFAALYAGVLMALDVAKTYYGGQGLYVVAALSGLTDMDAITLSASRMVRIGPEAGGIAASMGWRLIVLATIANLVFKWLVCLAVGRKDFARQVGVMFLIPALVGVGLLVFWPT